MSQYKRIFIVGHPGAGKAVLAKALAEKLGWQYIDADLGLEFHMGRTLNEIVGKQGEQAFQNTESAVLISLLEKENIVVATNGSIVCDEQNRKLLSSEFVVHLKVSTQVQMDRTARNQAPLLSIADLKAFFDKLHNERDSLYDKVSHLSINSDDNVLEDHVLNIEKLVSQDNKKLLAHKNLSTKDLIIFHKNLHTPVHLTEQQAMCLKLLVQGKTSKEIARIMNISFRTVEGYIANMIELLGCTSSKDLVALYHQP
jgi:shikimate kinase